jgi:hypothetical protein
MWTCPKCHKENESRFDLYDACGLSTTGESDLFLQAVAWWRSRLFRLTVALPFLYVGSYFLLSTHTSGFTDVSAKQWYHDRTFAFDRWVYKPLAFIEQ